jgi:flagellar hook-length control protein FliK
LASDAAVTAESATSTATQKPGEIAAQPAQAIEAGRNPGAATVVSTNDDVAAATVVMAAVVPSPAAAAENAKAPANRLTQIAEAPANPDAFALAAQTAEQGISLDANFTDAGITPLTDVTAKGNPFDSANLSSTTATGTQTLAAAAPAAPQSAASVSGLIATAPALAVVTASPAQIVDIVAESADDGQSDRVVVQLDPPELGRVSIDFKFDANGLQHVTITSETPEAMRQLRQMHSELVQSLERHGIGSENLSFQHQQQQGSPQSPPPNPFARAAALGDAGNAGAAIIASTELTPNARTLPGGRLDIRL